MFTLQESAVTRSGRTVAQNCSGGDGASLQNAAAPPEQRFPHTAFHIAAVQLHWDK